MILKENIVIRVVFLYIVYIFLYTVYLYFKLYIYIYIYIYITKKTQSQYLVLMGLMPWMNEFESKRIKFNLISKILLSNNYCIQKLY